MNVYVNNKLRCLDKAASVEEILKALSIHSFNGVAVAVNESIVPKGEWKKYSLKENDKILIIKATQGG